MGLEVRVGEWVGLNMVSEAKVSEWVDVECVCLVYGWSRGTSDTGLIECGVRGKGRNFYFVALCLSFRLSSCAE